MPEQASPALITEVQDVTQDSLERAWASFWEEKGEAYSGAIRTLKSYTPQLNPGTTQATLPVGSAMQEEKFTEVKEQLMSYMRGAVQNPGLLITTQLNEQETEKRPYTNQEKFAHLMKKQPLLKNLADELDLDPDL